MARIVKFNPWNVMDDIQREMNRMFDKKAITQEGDIDTSTVSSSQWTPSVDIEETDTEFVVKADVPGVDPKDIHVHVDHVNGVNVLTIKGERKSESKEEEKNFSRVEREWGYFSRQFTLPENVNTDDINAKSKHGVLQLTIPKVEKSTTTRKIDVQE